MYEDFLKYFHRISECFRMSYEDFLKYFHRISECFLPLDEREHDKKAWKRVEYSGEWVRGITNGGADNQQSECACAQSSC